jgi:protein-S-isoprenylcysteine O-methyltransferase Ste14
MDLRKAARDPWVWGQLGLFLVIGIAAPLLPRHVSLGKLDPVLNRIDPVPTRWLGWLLAGGGLAMVVWGVRSLGRSLTPGTEPLPDAPLVVSGAYAHVRHPIYLGIVLLLAGYTLAWSNWTLALLTGAVALGYFEGKARAEERWLAARYPGYAAYTRKVRRRVATASSLSP